jgi:LAS superfamily LD-carboxypeptidase LdcB
MWTQTEAGRSYLDAKGNPVTGWYEIQGIRYFFDENGLLATGWQEQDGTRFYLDPDGTLATGWRMLEDKRCYLDEHGQLASGWITIHGQKCYFGADGTPISGWTEIDGKQYYLNSNGVSTTGWVEADGIRRYFGENGTLYTGWLTESGKTYYFLEDGTMAVGEIVIDGQKYHFNPHGVRVILVNPWNALPSDLKLDLVQVDEAHQIDRACYEALVAMLSDCVAAGHDPELRSAYRTMDYQIMLHENKVKYYLDRHYSEEDARKYAAQVVAVPGTSEHQLGLAVDIADREFKDLTDEQAKTATQKWLMSNSWRYGFILRYPNEKSAVTGIIYEPWHYRYVGKTTAKAIYESGLCLEEYLERMN